MADTTDVQTILKKRFAELVPPVQKAILSEDIPKHLRALADVHKLHLDQWESLENEVMLALFGVTPIDELQTSIKKEVGVNDEIAAALAADISKVVFEPIRRELERELEHPDAGAENMSDVETARAQMLANQPKADLASGFQVPAASSNATSLTPVDPSGSSQLEARSSVVPATPPPPPPTTKVDRGPTSGAYKPGEPSAARKSVEDDPYREPPQ